MNLANLLEMEMNKMESSLEKGRNFEKEVVTILRTLGAEVKHDIGIAGNQIDILAIEKTQSGSTIKTIVECKAFKKLVGLNSINKFAGIFLLLKQRNLADKAMIVSKSGFTRKAREAAETHSIELKEIEDLQHEIIGKETQVTMADKDIDTDEHHKSKRIFVLMPFGQEFDDVYIFGIREVAEDLGLIVERADEIEDTGEIIEMIREHIKEADLIIADTTGLNPNVMYEVGFSHGLDKTTILICRTQQSLPFDIKGTNHIMYESIVDLRERLKRRLSQITNDLR